VKRVNSVDDTEPANKSLQLRDGMARHCLVLEEKTKATSLVLHCAIQTTLNEVSEVPEADAWASPGGARKVSQ
jgi:hypothetical protein